MACTSSYARVRVSAALFLVSIVLISATSTLAQGTGVTVSGTVKDASGGVIANADVQTVVAGRILASATSGDDGRYRIEAPKSAPFELRVRQPGFAEYAADIRGATADLTKDVTLQIGSISDTLVVTASRGAESRTTVTSSVTVATAADIHAMGAIQLADVLRFVPGVAVEGNGTVYIADSGNDQVLKLPVR